HIGLIAGGTNGQIGRVSDLISIDLTRDFASFTTTEKEVLSLATASDIVGVTYAFYQYLGPARDGVDLAAANFGDATQWRQITPDYTTGTNAKATRSVYLSPGQTVLAQLNGVEYGLYQYRGQARLLN